MLTQCIFLNNIKLLQCLHMYEKFSCIFYCCFTFFLNYNLNMRQMKCKFLYCSNVKIFDIIMYWFLYKCQYFVCIYFYSFRILTYCFALTTCITIFKGADDRFENSYINSKIWNIIVLLGDEFNFILQILSSL